MIPVKKILLILLPVYLLVSCKKDDVKSISLASLNITNAIVGGTAAKLGSYPVTITNNSFSQYTLRPGSQTLYIYPSTDSLHPYYNGSIAPGAQETYSLFLAGQSSGTIDNVLIKDTIPHRTDSSMGIRFINLSPNSNPLNITLSATPTVNEVSNLTYKNYTGFKTYTAFYNASYTFQVRDASTNTVLASVSYTSSTVPRFANVTLVIRGLQGGSPAIGITTVKNDR